MSDNRFNQLLNGTLLSALLLSPLCGCKPSAPAVSHRVSAPSNPSKPELKELVCDNGLNDWLLDTNHQLGHYIATNTRILRTTNGDYMPQFNLDGQWVGIFDNDKAYRELWLAQHHLRRAFEVKVGVNAGIEDALRSIKL